MKASFWLFIISGMLCISAVQAQQFESGSQKRPSAIQEKETRGGKVVEPSQHSTVVVMMSENGLEVLSPGAPKELGIGEKVVSETIEHEQQVGNSTYDSKPFGGIRLFGWFF